MYADIIVGFVRYNLNPPLSSCQLYIEADLQPHHQQQQHNKKLRKIHRGAIPTTTTYAYAAATAATAAGISVDQEHAKSAV